MRGRPPIPAYLHLIRGNPSKRRIRQEPQPALGENVPEPPAYLSDYARAEWVRLAPELHRLRLLTVADLSTFAVYCASYAKWRMAEEALAAGADPAAAKVLAQVASAACRDMVAVAAHFGLSPVARARVAAGVGPKPPGKFDDLIG
jgi:P27 family predicted phage terminase small subunit